VTGRSSSSSELCCALVWVEWQGSKELSASPSRGTVRLRRAFLCPSWVPDQRDRAVDEFIELVAAVDGILRAQAKADADYFAAKCGRVVPETEASLIAAAFLKAYRWQYIHSGAEHPQFRKILTSLITEQQGQRIQQALATLQ
jgi:hypothetical protein